MSLLRKSAVGLLIGLALALLLAALLIPRLVDIDRYRSAVIASIQSKTGKPARISHLALSVFPAVRIRVDDFALGNPSGFPPGDLVSASRVYANVQIADVWRHHLTIDALDLRNPVIHLYSDELGRWNFEKPRQAQVEARSAGEQSPQVKRTAFSMQEISKINISGGVLTIASVLPSGAAGAESLEARGFSVRLEHVVPSAFGLSQEPKDAPSHEQPKALPTVPPSVPDGEHSLAAIAYRDSAQYPSTPASAALGTLAIRQLRLGKLQFNAVKSALQFGPAQVLVHHVTFDCSEGRGSGTVSINFGPPRVVYVAQVKVTGVDMASLLASFPEAQGKMTGKMDGELTLSGETVHSADPLAGKRGSGRLVIHNGQMPTLQLKKNLLLVANLLGLGSTSGDPSAFSSLSADLDIADSKITGTKIRLSGNGIDVDGSGSLALQGEGRLDYQGVARVAAAQNAISALVAGLAGADLSNGKLSLPFTLQGTPQHPVFKLKSKRAFGRAARPFGSRSEIRPTDIR